MTSWIPVSSSRASAIRYEPEVRAIFVRFPDSAVYQYDDCGPDVWARLTAPGVSIGKFISTVLDRHPYRRISG